MPKLILGLFASLAMLLLMAAVQDPQGPHNPVQICGGCSAFSAGLPPICPANVGVTVDRKIFRPGVCGCVGAECQQARNCLAIYQMTVTDAQGAHTFTASTNQCGGYEDGSPTGEGCSPGFIFATCTPCAESCL